MRRLRELEVTPVLAVVVLGGAALLGIAGGVVAIAISSAVKNNDQRATVERIVVSNTQSFAATNRRAGAVRRVADVQAVAKTARLELAVNRQGRARLRGLDVETAAPAAEVLSAEAAVLTAYASAERLATPRREDVDRIERSLQTAERAHSTAAQHARREELALSIDPASVTANDNRAIALLKAASTKLAAWQKRVATIRAGRRERLLVINGYAKTFRSHIATYDKARASLDAWIEQVDTEGATFDEAYDFLADAARERGVASAAVQSIRPPAVVRVQHNAVVAAIARARDAVEAASNGVADYQFDYEGEYDTYKDTPGWRTFRAESKAVAAQYQSAVAEWQRRLDRLRSSLRSAPLPPHPEV